MKETALYVLWVIGLVAAVISLNVVFAFISHEISWRRLLRNLESQGKRRHG